MQITFEKNTFSKRLKSMLKVDFRRMFISRLFYIMAAISLFAPILILVMTTMMDGTVSVNPQTGEQTIIEGFDNVWQIIGSISGEKSSSAMGLTTMCNINLLYFGLAAFISLFVSEDFRSGYAKNLFTIRSKKSDYVISKTIVCFISGIIFILLFVIGSMLGGKISGLSFEMEGINAFNISMCVLSKMAIVEIFVPIYLALSVWGKAKTIKSMLSACAVGALMFMMIGMLSPLNAEIINVLICLIAGMASSIIFIIISKLILERTSLI